MGVKNIFKRYELKFMLTTQQYINNPKPIKTFKPPHMLGKGRFHKPMKLFYN